MLFSVFIVRSILHVKAGVNLSEVAYKFG